MRAVALLRAVNLGARRKVPMADLRAVATALGWTDLTTYLQSGNLVFTAPGRSEQRIASALEAALLDRFGFDVPVVLRTTAELRSLVERNPYAHVPEHTRVHVAFYAAPPDPAAVAAVDVARFAPEEYTVLGRDVVFHLPGGLGESKLAQTFFRRAKDGTARNWRTVTEVLALL